MLNAERETKIIGGTRNPFFLRNAFQNHFYYIYIGQNNEEFSEYLQKHGTEWDGTGPIFRGTHGTGTENQNPKFSFGTRPIQPCLWPCPLWP